MIKIRLKKQTKTWISLVFALIIILCIAAISRETVLRQEKEKTITAVSFVNKPAISYTVNLKPNSIFETDTLPEGNGYVGSILDRINIQFGQEFSGQEKAEISGDYTIKARIIASSNDKDKSEKIWEKTFILAAKKEFKATEGGVQLSADVPVVYDTYDNYAEQANTELKITASNLLRVEMELNCTVRTEDGTKTESFHPGVTASLGNAFVEVIKDPLEESPILIEKTISEKDPINLVKIIIIAMGLIIAAILLILLQIRGKEPTDSDLIEGKIKKILKEHGSRLVAIESKLPGDIKNVIAIHSMEDLIKISDEIEKPVFYYHNSNPGAIKDFFVISEVTVYVYREVIPGKDGSID